MITTSVDFTQFWRRAEQSKRAIRQDLALATRKAADEMVHVAKQGNFKDRTGQLRATIQALRAGWMGQTFWMSVKAPMPYSNFVDAGTKPHEIWPKAAYGLNGPLRSGQTRRATGKGPHEHIVGRGQFLRWKNDGGNQFFARMVHHPGTAATLFFHTAMRHGREKLIHELDRGFVNLRSVWQ